MFRLIAVLRWMLAVAVLLIGVPVGFAVAGGVPHGLPSVQQVQVWSQGPLHPGNAAVTAWIAVWLIWAAIAGLVVAAVLRRAGRVRWERIVGRLPPPMQGLAATVIGATALTTPLAATAAHAAPVPAAAGDTHDLTAETRTAEQPVPPAAKAAAVHASGADGEHVVVRDGDTLSSIAERCLGDQDQWPVIFALNRGTHFEDVGGTFTDPDIIYPGWTLRLPPPAAAPGPQPDQPPTPHDTDTPRPGPPAATTAPAQTAPSTPTPGPASSSKPTAPGSAEPDAKSTGAVPPAAPVGTSAPNTRTPGENPSDPVGRSASPGVQLGTGSWLDAGLATTIAAAAALIWAHRRRRYQPRPLTPDLRFDDLDTTALPPVITDIRRRLRISLEPATTTATVTSTEPIPANTADTDGDGFDIRNGLRVAADDAAGHRAHDMDPTSQPRPVVAALTTDPAAVAWPGPGLGLTGPGAEAAARGFLAATLADTDPHTPPGQVVLPAGTVAALFGDATGTLPATGRFTITTDLGEALTRLEQQVLHRSRLLADHDVDTVAALRLTDPHEEPLPPILLVADTAGNHDRTRLTAVLAQGQHLDIHGILLGTWPAGGTLLVAADGSTTPADTSDHQLAEPSRITVLTIADALAILAALDESRTGRPQPLAENRQQSGTERPQPRSDGDGSGSDPARVLHALATLGDASAAAVAAHLEVPYPAVTAELVQQEHQGHTETIRTDTGRTLWRLTENGRATLTTNTSQPAPAADRETTTSPPDDNPATNGDSPGAGRYAELETALRWPDGEAILTSEHPTDTSTTRDTTAPDHVQVTVLGPAGIVATKPDRNPRKKALELLVYLAVQDGSATVDAILDDLLPDAPASKAPERLYTYVSDLRAVMRRIGGAATYLTHPHRRYTLNPDTIDIDLWRMRAAIRDAYQATEPQHRITALRRVVELYRGPLAEDADYEWAEPYREAIRQQALDAHLALADALTDDPAGRAQILEAAITHSPYSEHLYQQAMRVRAELGHLDAIRALRRRLTQALAEIDAEPDDQTLTLADQLLATLHPRRREADSTTRAP